MISPTATKIKELSRTVNRLILAAEFQADFETPLSAYWKLASDETFSFLLESVTGGERLARYSLLGVRPKKVIRTKNGRVKEETPEKMTERSLATGEDPLHLLESELGAIEPFSLSGIAPFAGGAVGLMAYDLVRYFESISDNCKDDLKIDDMAMMLTSTVVIFDHAKNLIQIVAQSDPTKGGENLARAEIERVAVRLAGPLPSLPNGNFPIHPVSSNVTKKEFELMVTKMVSYIAAGDGVQFVPSQRFSTQVDAHPLTVYRALRSINPSPYMFLLRFGDYDLVGSSPELLVSLHDGKAHLRPIAGTRWRGKDDQEDKQLEIDLLKDEKERAEHVMLVDLGRNDLGRACDYGSVVVGDLMTIEKYSHVMHIVSDVVGDLRKNQSAYDLIRASFPAGTVSGAPKIRAMQIIDELESYRRGVYAGSVGFFSNTGNMDTCIAIRTILIKDGIGYVQAGGGVVYDSIAENEYVESCNKAKACLRAIEIAQIGL